MLHFSCARRRRYRVMKFMWFHLMPYTELPEDFREKHPSVWVDIHSSLFDPRRAHHMYNDFMDELEYAARSEEHTSELQSQFHLVCRLLLEKKKKRTPTTALIISSIS